MKFLVKAFLITFTLIQAVQAGRYYNTENGRFISRDPLGYVDGMSLYNAYFAERFALDPMGLEKLEEIEVWTAGRSVRNAEGAEDLGNRTFQRYVEQQTNHLIVDDIKKLSEGLNKLKCKCIKTLNIMGHANGGVRVANGQVRNWQVMSDAGAFGIDYDPQTGATRRIGEWGAFGKIKFCKPCTIILHGCLTGKGASGKAFYRELAKATGCTIRGWDVLTNYQLDLDTNRATRQGGQNNGQSDDGGNYRDPTVTVVGSGN